jgi:hypothetical protein
MEGPIIPLAVLQKCLLRQGPRCFTACSCGVCSRAEKALAYPNQESWLIVCRAPAVLDFERRYWGSMADSTGVAYDMGAESQPAAYDMHSCAETDSSFFYEGAYGRKYEGKKASLSHSTLCVVHHAIEPLAAQNVDRLWRSLHCNGTHKAHQRRLGKPTLPVHGALLHITLCIPSPPLESV